MSVASHQKRSPRARLVTLRGVVIPVEWDEQGKIVGIAISTHDEDEYRIQDDELGNRLRGLINEEVEVSGRTRKRKNRKIIIVETYKKIRDAVADENRQT